MSSKKPAAESASIIKVHSREWIDLNFLKAFNHMAETAIQEALKIVETFGVLDQHLYRRTDDTGTNTGSLVPFALRGRNADNKPIKISKR